MPTHAQTPLFLRRHLNHHLPRRLLFFYGTSVCRLLAQLSDGPSAMKKLRSSVSTLTLRLSALVVAAPPQRVSIWTTSILAHDLPLPLEKGRLSTYPAPPTCQQVRPGLTILWRPWRINRYAHLCCCCSDQSDQYLSSLIYPVHLPLLLAHLWNPYRCVHVLGCRSVHSELIIHAGKWREWRGGGWR